MNTVAEVAAAILSERFERLAPPKGLAIHQVAAAIRALSLIRRFGGAILADETGLGKSRVAVAVALELRRAGRALFIVPAPIVPQWRELAEMFDLDAEIVTHESLITRAACTSGLSLVVVDEAHRFRNEATARYARLSALVIGRPLLLMTASPISNRFADFQSLCALFLADDALRSQGVASLEDAFERSDPWLVARVAQILMIRRDRSCLTAALRFGAISQRVMRSEPPDGYRALRDQVQSLAFPILSSKAAAGMLRRYLLHRLESSPSALLDTLKRQIRFYRRAREELGRGHALTRRDYARIFEDDDSGWFQELLFPQAFLSPADAFDTRPVNAELGALEALVSTARLLPDRKAELLVRLLVSEPETTIVFTGAAATARALRLSLSTELRAASVSSSGCLSPSGQRVSAAAVLAMLQAGGLDVVVTTDRLSEGLNLQTAGRVVHYDIPWNPLRITQRNGRVHRIGQVRKEVDAWWFLPSHEQEEILGVVHTVARKRRAARLLDCDRPMPATCANRWLDLAAIRMSEGSAVEGVRGMMILPDLFSPARGELVAIVDSRLSDDWTGIDAILRRSGSLPVIDSVVSPAIRSSWQAIIAAREAFPAAVRRSSAELLDQLREGDLLTPSLRDRLLRRWPIGVERRIGAMSKEAVSPRAVRELEELFELCEGLTG